MAVKKIILFLFFLLLALPYFPAAKGQKPQEKPASPLSVSISPVVEGFSADRIEVGDTIDLVVEVLSYINADSLEVTIRPTGGIEVISGETSWTGPINKNTPLIINLTVRCTKKAGGMIRASARIILSKSTSFAAQAFFHLGPAKKKEAERPVPKILKDGKQRDIIEYRLER